MIPLKDDNPTRGFPLVTLVLLLANVVAFLYEVLGGYTGQHDVVAGLGVVPYDLLHPTELPRHGLVPVPLTIFTSMFLHAGWVHLGGNMLYLWIFGNNVEDEFGPIRFFFFYLFSGLVAALTHVASAPQSTVPVIGASGAVAGVLGAYAVLFPRARVLTLVPFFFFLRLIWLPATLLLGLWFLLQVVGGIPSLGSAGGGVAWFAHIGGFLTGMVAGLVYKRRRRRAYRAPVEFPFDDFPP